MATLTPKEEKWMRRVQKAIAACPSADIGFFTTGDHSISVYRILEDDFIDSEKDLCVAVNDAEADLGELHFPHNVHSTAG